MSSHLTAREAEPGSGVTFDHPAEVGHQINIIDVKRGVIEAIPKRDKVAIMGFATSSRSLAPFDDPSYEVWTLNQLYRHVPRCTRHFDIHRNWEEDNVEGTDHRGWIKEAGEAGIPTYMVEHHPDMPSTVQYPIDAVIEDVGCDYFTSTVAYEVALAVAEGFKEIALFGIDLIVGTEYDVQKANLEFHLGRAHGMGINVRIPPQSALLAQSHRYGYQKKRITDAVRHWSGRPDLVSGVTAGLRVADSWNLDDGLDRAEGFMRLEQSIKTSPVRLFLEGTAGLDQWGVEGGLEWKW